MTRLAAVPLTIALLCGATRARATDPSRSSSMEEAVLGGFGSTSDHLGVGPAVAFEIGGRRQLEGFSLGLGLRARYEHYSRGGAGTCSSPPAPLAGPCLGQTSGGYPYGFAETLFTFELPITARLGSRAGTILPYAGLAPGVVYDRSETSAATGGQAFASVGTAGRFSFHAFVGTQLHVGPGGLFFEWGIRASPTLHRTEGDSHLESFVGEVGYRLTL